MIQRIQSIFLFLAIIALSLFAFFPIAEFYSNTAIYSFNILGLKSFTPDTNIAFKDWFFIPVIVVCSLIIILDIIAFLSFKNRIRQIKLIQIAIFLNVIFIVGILFYYIPAIEEVTQTNVNYKGVYGVYLPLISLIFNVLAQYYIRKDEALVRSADRLR